MSNSNSGSSAGIGLPGVLAIVFVVLKLTDLIDWSWWWVLSPLWISAGIGLAMVVVIVLGALIFGGRKKARR